MDILSLTAVELGKKIKAGEVKVSDAVKAVLERAKAAEPEINSFVTLDEAGALAQAEEIQKKIDNGELTGPLAGVPVAVKDNMCIQGGLTTCSSKILSNFYPTFTAEAVLNLQKAGAVIIGKTNMDEFAMGSTTETSYYGPTKNPHHTGHVPGGSSGGSCAAVAAQECFYALGSDTGGSIRQPSAFCGVVGLKPTYGTVSRYGLVAYGSSLDQIGPIAKDVTDCAAVLEAVASYDVKDSTSVQREEYDFTSALTEERFDGVKYGYRTKEYEGLHNMYKKTRSEGFGTEVKRRIMLGSFVLSSGYYDAYYLKALRTKALIKQAFDKAFEKYDIILAPAAPTTAPELGKSLQDPIQMYLGDIYTVSVNLAGLPGMTIPVGKDKNGLPIGMQLIGDSFQEKKLIRAAYTFECATEKQYEKPAVIAGIDGKEA